MHVPAALALFVGTPLAQWGYGAGQVVAGDGRRGAVSLCLGGVHVVNWVAWLGYRSAFAPDARAWFAVPEFVAALSFGVWIAALAVWLATDDAS